MDVEALSVLADDNKVEVAHAAVAQRRKLRGQELDRADVGVEFQAKAQAEEDVGGVLHIGHARVAQRAQEHHVVVPAQVVERALGQRDAGGQVALRPPVEFREDELVPAGLSYGPQHLECLRGHIQANPVAGNHRNPFLHWPSLAGMWGDKNSLLYQPSRAVGRIYPRPRSARYTPVRTNAPPPSR